jgi:hypothetical protein
MRALLASFAVLAATLTSCAQDGPTMLLVIDAEETIRVPEDFNEVRVEVTGSRSDAVSICEPELETKLLGSRSDLPFRIRLFRGEHFSEWVQIRVRAMHIDDEVMRTVIRRFWFDEDEERVLEVTLDASCLGEECDEGLHCDAGRCVVSPEFWLFDEEETEWVGACEED